MSNQPDSDHFVSQSSFHDVLMLLAENREVIREQVGALSGQLTEVGRQITARQDISNGRVSASEKAIVGLADDVGGVKRQVDEILEKGCRVKDEHAQQLATIMVRRMGGIVDPVSDLADDPSGMPFGWTKQQTVRRVGIGSGLVGFGVLLPHLITGLHWALEHFMYVAPVVAK